MHLQVENLTVQFDSDEGTVHAVNGVSFTLHAGETLGLVGESGCGKSVTAMSIPRLVPTPPGRFVSGRIALEGEELLSAPVSRLRQLRGGKIGVIFQEPMTALSPLHRIGMQLAEGLALHHPEMGEETRQSLALQWLARVGIADPHRCMRAFPFELSGGMRQRVMIAMAMLPQPQLVIADEPTTALDVTVQAQILELLREVTNDAQHGRAVLLITHDLGVIWQMCTRVIVMYASRIVEEAPVDELFARPAHPYTRALLATIPAMHKSAGELHTIPGNVPSLLKTPSGCAFAERCPCADAQCRRELPPQRLVTPAHRVFCHRCIPQLLPQSGQSCHKQL